MAMADETAETAETTELTILVCSANVGNAEPTAESFARWIPLDGDIAAPLSSTKYPVHDGLHEGAEAVAASLLNSRSNEGEEVREGGKRTIAEEDDDVEDDGNKHSSNSKFDDNKKFDIIVLGMQEAAFVDKTSKYYDDKSSTELETGGETTRGGETCDGDGSNTNNKRASIEGKFKTNVRTTMAAQAMEQLIGTIGNAKDVTKKKETTETATATATAKSSVASERSSDATSNNIIAAIANEAVKEGVDAVLSAEKRAKKKKNTICRKADKTNLVLRGLTTSQEYKSPKLRRTRGDGIKDRIKIKENAGSYDTRKFMELIDARCPSYSVVATKLRGEMRLIILALRDVADRIEDVYIAGENTGLGSVLANKGGIITTLTLRGTRLSFMTAHLEAHEGAAHLQNRNKNLAEIFAGAKTDPQYQMHDATVLSHHMFVCGDLNYRTNFLGDGGDDYSTSKDKKKGKRDKMKRGISKAVVSARKLTSPSHSSNDGNDVAGAPASPASKEERGKDNGSHFARAKELVDAEDWKALNEGDELARALEKKDCLVGFETLPCNWPPTFKVARGEGYQYNEKRTPSYTDRILWKSAHGMENNVVPFLYEPCPDFITSDHKPIRGGYVVKMKNATKCNKKPPKPKKGTRESNLSNTHERQVNLLISNIKCTDLPIMDSELLGGLSDPYILFVSYPKPLLWRKGWHSTKIIKRNLNPVWEEDIHLTLDDTRCKDDDGSLTLHGSMLYMTVMDEDFSSGDDVIGTVALNLNNLCSELNISPSSSSNANHVQETVVSTPVLRDGLEYGMMECTISSAYLTQKETKGFLKMAKRGEKVRSKTRKKTLTNIISNFLRL